jgi:hypothetical protein
MAIADFYISGRFFSGGTKAGIQGLLLKAFDPQQKFTEDRLGCTNTHQDGTFLLSFYQKEHPDLFAARPALKLQVYDRDGKHLFTTQQTYVVEVGSSEQFDLELTTEQVENHLSRPLTLERKTGRLLAKEKLNPIYQSISLLSNPSTPEYLSLMETSFCTLPPIDRFEDLLDDALEVLDGDIPARKRFLNTLSILEQSLSQSEIETIPVPGNHTANHSFANPVLGPSVAPAQVGIHLEKDVTLDETVEKLAIMSEGLSPVEDLLGREAIFPVVLAAAMVTGPAPSKIFRSVQIILRQFAAYHPITILRSAAMTAVSGGERELRYFQAILQTLDTWCRSDGLPIPEFPEDFPPLDFERAEHAGCTAASVRAIPHIVRGAPSDSIPTYTIDSVRPAWACAGDTVVIQGSGFSSWGAVRFPGGPWNRNTPVDAGPITWTDTEIQVRIPEEAGCGPLTLRIPLERVTVSLCDAFFDYSPYRTPTTETEFRGCTPRILSFEVNDGLTCAWRGESASLHWHVYPPDAEVLIKEERNGISTILYNGSEAVGSLALDTNESGPREFSITARNSHIYCGVASRDFSFEVGLAVPTLTIFGTEVTQGIQRFDLTDPMGPASNSVGLIAGMDTIVRVYVQSTRPDPDPEAELVTGRIVFRGRTFRPINGNPPGSAPFVNAPPFIPDPRETDSTLNFLIPAALASGDGTLFIELFAARRCAGFVSTEFTQPVSFVERPAFPVTIRRLADPGTGEAVSVDGALRIVMEAFRRLPSPRTEIRLHPGVFSIYPDYLEADYCRGGPFNQYHLAVAVAYEHNAIEGRPNRSAWIGLFAQRDCSPGGMMSWPYTSTCISSPGPISAAHELAHCIGMGHTITASFTMPDVGEECDDLFQPIPCHHLPNNGHLVDDTPFDITTNTVIRDSWDLMSYRFSRDFVDRRFLHPDHWERVRDLMDGRF